MMQRCQVHSLSNEARWQIGNNELKNLKNKQNSKEIDQGTYEKRRTTIVDFISGNSNRIDSDGVVVEFFVQ
jgi:hypothetical protein